MNWRLRFWAGPRLMTDRADDPVLVLTSIAHVTRRQAPAFGLDASGTVDAINYRLQVDGLSITLTKSRTRGLMRRPDTLCKSLFTIGADRQIEPL